MTTAEIHTNSPVLPSEADVVLARQASRILRQCIYSVMA